MLEYSDAPCAHLRTNCFCSQDRAWSRRHGRRPVRVPYWSVSKCTSRTPGDTAWNYLCNRRRDDRGSDCVYAFRLGVLVPRRGTVRPVPHGIKQKYRNKKDKKIQVVVFIVLTCNFLDYELGPQPVDGSRSRNLQGIKNSERRTPHPCHPALLPLHTHPPYKKYCSGRGCLLCGGSNCQTQQAMQGALSHRRKHVLSCLL